VASSTLQRRRRCGGWRWQWLLLLPLPILLGGLLLILLDRLLPPDLSHAYDYATTIHAADGTLLRLFPAHDGRIRLPITLDQIDPQLIKLLVATEDRRFWSHAGIDLLALLRAAGQLLSQQRVVSGGSTITMQLARLLQPRPRTLSAKVIEMFRAWQLERRLSKRQILEHYLTLTPYGGAIEGIGAATWVWFGKSPRHLSAAEAALLVALPQAPEQRRPDRFPAAAARARDQILQRAIANHQLAPLTAPLPPLPTAQRRWPQLAPLLARRLQQQRALNSTAGAPPSRIDSCIDATLQQQLTPLIKRVATTLDRHASGAAVVISLPDQRVVSYVGSADFFDETRHGQVDMVKAWRSPGSTLKPLIYGIAFDLGIAHPQSVAVDAPNRIGHFRPTNYDRRYRGEVTLSEALQLSLNTVAVQLLQQIGATPLLARLARHHITPRHIGDQAGLALALGGVSLRLEDLLRLYGAIARDGVVRPLRYRACDAPTFEQSAPPPALMGEQARQQLQQILLDVPRPSGGSGIALKTGTSYGGRDAWAIGWNRHYLAAIWFGRADGSALPGLTGAGAAVPPLLQLFDRLPAAPLPRYPQLSPPAALTRLTAVGAAQNPPRIAFPNASTLLFADPQQPPLPLEADGGTLPLTWLVNDQPLATDQRQPRHSAWRPEHSGFADIVVVDGLGRRDAVTVTIRDPAQPLPIGRLTPQNVNRALPSR